MLNLAIVSAADGRKLFARALDFVLKYEMRCCGLMQRILQEDNAIQVIVEKGTEKSFSPQVYGVFTYNPKGRTVFSCLPVQNEEVTEVLTQYFSQRSVFCITGDVAFTNYLLKIILSLRNNQYIWHDYYLMEHTNSVAPVLPKGAALFRCTKENAEDLMPLQLDYTRVEVNPEWKPVNAASERFALEATLQHQYMVGVKCNVNGTVVVAAKANTNAISLHYNQIGGVYTLPQFRGNGFATALVSHIAAWTREQRKQAVLFVKEKNASAIAAYKKAGFTFGGHYKIVYFKE